MATQFIPFYPSSHSSHRAPPASGILGGIRLACNPRIPPTDRADRHVKRVLAEMIRTLRHDFVFSYLNKPITTAGGVHKSFEKACKRAGIPRGQNMPNEVIFHDIRRTVKTNMLNAGVDKVHRDIILGHSLHGMDMHYMSPSEDDLHRAMA